MNKNIIVVLGGAILAAVLVAMLVQVTLGGKKGSDGVEVLVAAKELRMGAELQKGDLKWKKWPEETVFKSAIVRGKGKKAKEAHQVLKGRLSQKFSEGEAVTRDKVLSGKGNNVVARLDPGERAVSIKVNASAMVAGFIAPGSYVDVILTYKKHVFINDGNKNSSAARELISRNLDKIATETIIENVRVLAVDQKAERDSGDKIRVGKTVTLAVNIRDAEKLALASEMGDITLAMRGVGDEALNEAGAVVTDARISTIDDEIIAEYQRLKVEDDMSSTDIKIYNGDKVEVKTGVKGGKSSKSYYDLKEEKAVEAPDPGEAIKSDEEHREDIGDRGEMDE